MSIKWKPTGSLETLKQRAFFYAKIREFFLSKNVLEVETPVLSAFANTDINLENFSSQKINDLTDSSFLRTSPEFPLKRLLCAGYGDVFEIAKVFRRGELSSTHNMEFSMLEWYRVEFVYMDLIDEISELFNFIASHFNKSQRPVRISSFSECFKNHLDIDISNTSSSQLNTICCDYGYSGSELTYEQCMDFLFATQIQPQLGNKCIQFVTHYPAAQAALSELDSNDSRWSLRFEFFIDGIEFGNGYQELTDAKELRLRFEQDNKIREESQQCFRPMDELLLKAMQSGMPSCSGVAIGLDRWLMYLLDLKSIQSAISFSTEVS